ncbi:uncharacterized protein LOC144150133 [Haemaphysalis longicornis]
MAELKFMQYLREEEQLILSMLDVFTEHLNKLKVEEMNIKMAIREQQIAEGKKGSSSQDGIAEASGDKSESGPAGFSQEDEFVSMEDIDLRVPDALHLGIDVSPPNYMEQEEEEEDDDEEDEG